MLGAFGTVHYFSRRSLAENTMAGDRDRAGGSLEVRRAARENWVMMEPAPASPAVRDLEMFSQRAMLENLV